MRLENKQREARRQQERDAEAAARLNEPPQEVEPFWFRTRQCDIAEGLIYEYRGGYWEAKASGDWSACPGIF